jgi:hypothetical protein
MVHRAEQKAALRVAPAVVGGEPAQIERGRAKRMHFACLESNQLMPSRKAMSSRTPDRKPFL